MSGCNTCECEDHAAGSCGCGCGCKPPPKVCPPTILSCSARVRVSADDAGVTLPRKCVCGDNADPSKLSMKIRRRGECDWTLEYPAWDIDDAGGIRFIFDQKFFDQKLGRYEAELSYDGEPCATVELDYRRDCIVKGVKPVALKRVEPCYPSAPQGVNPVFDQLYTFCTTLCAIMEKDAQVLPICAPDVLCDLVLCRPVQLAVDDGVHHELVEFAACSSGQVVVTRGVGGTVPQRFPAGSRVMFVWSPDNVLAAVEGC